MALEATHMRVALDLQDLVGVKSIDRYLSGTIYPDSRYVTKIARELTHDAFDNLNKFPESDFDRGWYVHLLVDEIQKEIHTDLFARLLGSELTNTEKWTVYSGIKVVQDINDHQKGAVYKYVESLDHIETPKGENRTEVKKYNSLFKELYSVEGVLSLDEYKDVWTAFNVAEESVQNIYENAVRLMTDEEAKREIEGVYSLTLDGAKKRIGSLRL